MTATNNENLYMVPILYGFFMLCLIICILVWIKKRKVWYKWLPHVLFYGCFIQLMFGCLFLYSDFWVMGVQLASMAMLGLWSCYRERKEDYELYAYISLFNFFVLMGRVAILGYTQNFYTYYGNDNCTSYYNLDCDCNIYCNEWPNVLQVLAYLLFFVVPIESFVAYQLAETPASLRKEGLMYYLTQISDSVENRN